MLIEVKATEFAESVQSASLLLWRKQVGDTVRRDEALTELETDKIVLEVPAPADGVLMEIRAPAGSEVKTGDVLAVIDTQAARDAPDRAASAAPPAAAPDEPAPAAGQAPEKAPETAPETAPSPRPSAAEFLPPRLRGKTAAPTPPASGALPAPARIPAPSGLPTRAPSEATPGARREPMTRLRQRIAERLKAAQNTAAMLTTFNEINMQPVMDMRRRLQERFVAEYGVKLGYMSFFTKAVCLGLKAFPVVNAMIDGQDIVYSDACHIGIAVSSDRGLVVPVLRNAETLRFAEIEQRIADFARRANDLQLKLEDMEGGTFTISNGGVFGSLFSTPILNPPQSAVLGLHKIEDRPVAENGEVVIRPMMYVALTYDHRLIDGREAVSFLRSVKEALEDPARLLLEV